MLPVFGFVVFLQRTKRQEPEVLRRWRWVWSVSLLASIFWLAGLSAVSPAITSIQALSMPVGSALGRSHTACHIQRREATMGHFRLASHITRLQFFALRIHTRRDLRVPIYARKWSNAQRYENRHACIFTHAPTVLDLQGSVCELYLKRLVCKGCWPL